MGPQSTQALGARGAQNALWEPGMAFGAFPYPRRCGMRSSESCVGPCEIPPSEGIQAKSTIWACSKSTPRTQPRREEAKRGGRSQRHQALVRWHAENLCSYDAQPSAARFAPLPPSSALDAAERSTRTMNAVSTT